MAEGYQPQQLFSDVNTRLRDMEEKQRLIQERSLLIGKSIIDEREKNFSEIQAMKKSLIQLKEDILRMKELVQRITEQLESSARKEEVLMLQRQFDLFRK